jgi:predicted dehydrogenase
MLNIGVIGCGKMAESHLFQIKRIPLARLAGVCDSELLMARQAAIRCGVQVYFDDVEAFLDAVRPDVVHITTPPQSHYELTMKCLDLGIHVYVEKPIALNVRQTEALLNAATKKGLKLAVGHNAQFSPAMNEMRRKVASGYLGGNPIHMESYYCYNIENQQYAQALLGDSNHWVRNLPGTLIQNTISHGIAKIAEFIETDDPQVRVLSHVSPLLKSIGEEKIADELRVIIHDRNNLTAYLTFSTQIRPAALHQFRIYGPKNAVFEDHNTQTVQGIDNVSYKSYLNYVLPQLKTARDYFSGAFRNVKGLLSRRLTADFCMHYLVKQFYSSITEGGDPPIPYREIRLTYLIMDRIIEEMEHYGQSDDKVAAFVHPPTRRVS